ncbi:MAG: hypothetical protein JF619_01160, partial [Massilia sp.]|nr:hypothetical protein [Massilia sp.]
WAERIPAAEIGAALAACGGDVARCAALLKTPTESLRREVRRLRDAAGQKREPTSISGSGR